jgi:hypothetical protein
MNEDDHRRGLAERLFTAVNIAVFAALTACVVAAAVLWELWH